MTGCRNKKVGGRRKIEKSFAAGVDRTVIEKGAELLGVEINELISDGIMGMRKVADAIGL